MGWTFNKIPLRGILSGIMESIGDIRNINGDMLGSSNDKNQTKCRCCQELRGGLVKVNTFDFSYTSSAMVQEILVDVVTYNLDDLVHNGLEDRSCDY